LATLQHQPDRVNSTIRNDESERAILGTVLADSSVFPIVRDTLKVEEFFDTRHRVIFRSMLRLDALSSPIDLITVSDELGAEIGDAGGMPYVASLGDSLMRVSNVAQYVRIVRNKALAREMLANHQLIEEQLREGCEDPRAICARNVEVFNTLAAQHGSGPLSWRTKFHRIDELPEGDIDFAIDNFLPYGVNFLGAFSGIGKSWLLLSMARALTTGKRFLGIFPVRETIPVLYLCPEMSAKGFRRRAERFGIDMSLFFCQTIADDGALDLGDPLLLAAVRDLKPALFLDTLLRFNNAEDESSATQNSQGLGRALFRLIYHGARVIEGAHHRAKNAASSDEPTLESTLRGTSDLGAMCDAVWCAQYDKTGGSSYIIESRKLVRLSLSCVKARDFATPEPFTVQLLPFLDQIGDFGVLTQNPLQSDQERVCEAIAANPRVTKLELETLTNIGRNRVEKLAFGGGWTYDKGSGWGRKLV
jgi:hypothetical protein